jgi:hypothetical protein
MDQGDTVAPEQSSVTPAPHTPLPWSFSPWHIEEGSPAVRAPAGYIVCTTASDNDAKYIARACNSHYALVEALEECVTILDGAQSGFIPGCGSDIAWQNGRDERIASARAALSAAKGET